MATRKDKLFRLKRQVERNARLKIKDTERKDKTQIFNEVAMKEMHFKVNAEKHIVEIEKEFLFKSLEEIHMIKLLGSGNTIMVPRSFSLCTHYSETLKVIKDFASALFHNMGYEVVLNFTNCQKADTAALFLMLVIRLELMEKIQAIQNKLYHHNVIPKITTIPAKSKDVNRLLIVTGYLSKEDFENTAVDDSFLKPIDDIGYLKGLKAQKHYRENKKGPHSKKVVEYINECLYKHGYKFEAEGKNLFEGIVAEVLSNAEDHSIFPNWYMTANFSQEDFNAGPNYVVGEINLTILNFGNSMYEGFLSTMEDNYVMFSNIDTFVSEMFVKYPSLKYTKEHIFTMALLQDQVSRLKFEDESRGTGTIKFITSFLDLGDFNNKERGYIPNLSIITGHTHINCDSTSKPMQKNGVIGLALNSVGDLKVPPETAYLKNLEEKFPGTLISVKIYLNKAHLDRKYGGQNHD